MRYQLIKICHIKTTGLSSYHDHLTFLSILIFSFTALLSDITQRTDTSTHHSPTDASPHNTCPRCGSENLIKNGSIHNGKPKQACKDCGKKFVDKPQNTKVSSQTKQLIDKLLLERISLRGVARVVGVSWDWLQQYVNDKMSSIPRQIKVSEKTKGPLTIESSTGTFPAACSEEIRLQSTPEVWEQNGSHTSSACGGAVDCDEMWLL